MEIMYPATDDFDRVCMDECDKLAAIVRAPSSSSRLFIGALTLEILSSLSRRKKNVVIKKERVFNN